MVLGVYWNQPVCVKNASFCQSAGRDIRSHYDSYSLCYMDAFSSKNM